MPQTEGLSIDRIIDQALRVYNDLPESAGYKQQRLQISELRKRLSGGKLRLAVLGQFNRGKSTFINALLQLHVLPASVLPITSVPTVITYGSRHECTVSFLNDKPPQKAQDSLDAINKLLIKYVAEENNPQNRLQVADVTVECSSTILHHGTVLIDTPGFGSTHIHNTQTTLDLLSSCDAALFLLSADLPITQLEVDFLKNVQKHVPRIFFIFNKTDLLGGEELEKTQNYIRGILSRELPLTGDIRLFPVSAIQAERSKYGDKMWGASGMEVIKTEIIDFMLREKYFTLAEALNSKLHSALSHTRKLLDSEKQQHIDSLEKIAGTIEDIKKFSTHIRNEIDKENELFSVERKAFHQRIGSLLNSRIEGALQKDYDYIEQLLSEAPPGKGQIKLVWNSLEKITKEIFESVFKEMKNAIIRPLLNAETAHRRQLNKIMGNCKSKECFPAELELLDEPDPEEIEALRGEYSWEFPPFPSLAEIRFSLFESTEKRREQAKQQIKEQLNEHFKGITTDLEEMVRSIIDQSMERLLERFNRRYNNIKSILSEQLGTLEDRLKHEKEKHTPQIEKLDGFARRIADVERMLV